MVFQRDKKIPAPQTKETTDNQLYVVNADLIHRVQQTQINVGSSTLELTAHQVEVLEQSEQTVASS